MDGNDIRIARDEDTLFAALADPVGFRRVADRSADIAPVDEVVLSAPVPAPPQFIGVGLNYRDHAAEVGAATRIAGDLRFHRTATVGPGQPIELPALSETVDWEAELAIVIGRGGRDIRWSTSPGTPS